MERRGDDKGGLKSASRAPRKSAPPHNYEADIMDRLARIETHLESFHDHKIEFAGIRDEFVVMRARWGVAAGFMGAFAAVLMHVLLIGVEWVMGRL